MSDPIDLSKGARGKYCKFAIFNLAVVLKTGGSVVVSVACFVFKLILEALMYVIVTCKYKMDPIKNSRENKSMVFPDAQGQLTPQSVVGSG